MNLHNCVKRNDDSIPPPKFDTIRKKFPLNGENFLEFEKFITELSENGSTATDFVSIIVRLYKMSKRNL